MYRHALAATRGWPSTVAIVLTRAGKPSAKKRQEEENPFAEWDEEVVSYEITPSMELRVNECCVTTKLYMGLCTKCGCYAGPRKKIESGLSVAQVLSSIKTKSFRVDTSDLVLDGGSSLYDSSEIRSDSGPSQVGSVSLDAHVGGDLAGALEGLP